MPFITSVTRQNIPGRRPKDRYLSRKDAETKARQLIVKNSLTDLGYDLIALLATTGILTTRQMNALLKVAPSTLRKYQSEEYQLIRWRYAPRNVPSCFPHKRLEHVYTLTEVGIAIARERGWCSEHFERYNHHRAVHDLLCNEAATRFIQATQNIGMECEWLGAWESRLHGKDGDVILEPDSLLRVRRGDTEKAFAVEYHNEDDRRRSGDKVKRYEDAAVAKQWEWQWKLDRFPTVLIAVTNKVVIDGYIGVLETWGAERIKCRYLAKSIEAVTDDNDDMTQWLDVNRAAFTGEWEHVDLFSV